jgi:hypothetical protein
MNIFAPNFTKPTLDSKYFVKNSFAEFFFFGGATARGGPLSPLQYASKSLEPLLGPYAELLSINTNKTQLCNRIYYFKVL